MKMKWKGNSLTNSGEALSAYIYLTADKKYRAVIAQDSYFIYWSTQSYKNKNDAKFDLERALTNLIMSLKNMGV